MAPNSTKERDVDVSPERARATQGGVSQTPARVQPSKAPFGGKGKGKTKRMMTMRGKERKKERENGRGKGKGKKKGGIHRFSRSENSELWLGQMSVSLLFT